MAYEIERSADGKVFEVTDFLYDEEKFLIRDLDGLNPKDHPTYTLLKGSLFCVSCVGEKFLFSAVKTNSGHGDYTIYELSSGLPVTFCNKHDEAVKKVITCWENTMMQQIRKDQRKDIREDINAISELREYKLAHPNWQKQNPEK